MDSASLSEMSPRTQEEVVKPQQFRMFEKEIQIPNGETVKLSSMHVERMQLFHGSTVAGIKKFVDAEETTVGAGVYLTTQRDSATGYAKVREIDRRLTDPAIVYETEIADMNILNLSTADAILNFMKFIRPQIYLWDKNELPKVKFSSEFFKETYHSALVDLNIRIAEWIKKGHIPPVKSILQQFGDPARKILMREEFDGLMTIEGGEYQRNPNTGEEIRIGDHDSYVIFQPDKVRIVKEEKTS